MQDERYREVIDPLPRLDADFDGAGDGMRVALVRVRAIDWLHGRRPQRDLDLPTFNRQRLERGLPRMP